LLRFLMEEDHGKLYHVTAKGTSTGHFPGRYRLKSFGGQKWAVVSVHGVDSR